MKVTYPPERKLDQRFVFIFDWKTRFAIVEFWIFGERYKILLLRLMGNPTLGISVVSWTPG